MNEREAQALVEEVATLRERVADYEELVRAIRTGEVDALFVGDGDDCRTLTLGDAGSVYRALVEAMTEGAAIVQRDGTLVYCNRRLAAMLGKPLESVMGSSLLRFVARTERAVAARLLAAGRSRPRRRELKMLNQTGGLTPVQWSVSPLELSGHAGICVVATDLTERNRVQEALRSLSLHDELTGLFNRRGFIMHAEQQLKLALRIAGQLLLVFADVDGLKPINDVLGHKAGDSAIRDAAEVLRHSFRDSDIVARLGGDEFAVLATGTDGHAIDVIHRRVQERIDEHNKHAQRPYRLSLSVGIVPYDPAQPVPVSELLTRADAAMYANKRDKRRGDARIVLPEIPVEDVCLDVPPGTCGRADVPLTGVWEWTIDDNRVRWSTEMREALGIVDFDGTLPSFVALLHADDRLRVLAEARRALASHRSLVSKFRMQGADGTVRLVAGRAHGEYDPHGRAHRLVGTLTDVSAFAAANDLAHAALDSIGANICILDGDSRIVSVNRGWREYALANGAADPSLHLGMRYLDVCAADEGPQAALSRRFAAGLAEVIAERRTHFEQEYPCHSPHAQRWFRVSAVRLEIGGAKRVMVRHEEVTGAVVLEDCLSESLYPSRNHGDAARDGIFIVQDERIVFVNHACAQMLATTAEQIVGLRFTDLLTAGQARLWRARLAAGARTRRRNSEGRVVLQTANGAQIEVTAAVTPTLYNNRAALLGTLRCTRQ